MGKVLLLGNGVNRISTGYSWDSLVNNLITVSGAAVTSGSKPFPLLFEEIVFQARAVGGPSEEGLIKQIVQDIGLIQPHQNLSLLLAKFDEVMTTNYDHNLETSCPGFQNTVPKSSTTETIYNRYRSKEVGTKKIWHIHGEADTPRSICVGYERYGANIQKVRDFIIHGDPDRGIAGMTRRMSQGNIQIKSWIDHFFVSDIDIVGLGMDYQEIDLWWLLDYRAREIMKARKAIQNRLRFFCTVKESADKIDLLRSLNVSVVPTSCALQANGDLDYNDFYQNVLNRL